MTSMGFTSYDGAAPYDQGELDGPDAYDLLAEAAEQVELDRIERDRDEAETDVDAARSPFSEVSGDSLSDRDRRILEFERQWWKYAGAKEQAIRDLFDMSATRYYQILNALIDSPAALEFDPMLVKRLRRLRASRQRARSARRLGVEL